MSAAVHGASVAPSRVTEIHLAFNSAWRLLKATETKMPKHAVPKPTETERAELDPYIEGLKTLPFVRSTRLTRTKRTNSGADAELEIKMIDGSTTKRLVEVKTSHLRADVDLLRPAMQRQPSAWLLAAPYVGKPLGDRLQALEINFVDRHGNCYLRVGDRYVARIQGRAIPKPRSSPKALRAAGYQVMFALLAKPELVAASQRDIGTQAGTSRQPVADLIGRLVAERVLVKRGRHHDWVHGPDRALLDRWVAGYRDKLRPRLFVGRFRLPVTGPKKVERWLEDRAPDVCYGGTAGAYRLIPHYRGETTVAYLGPPTSDRKRALKALAADDGELLWMRHIGEVSKASDRADTVHPLLVYAELISDADPRAAETAGLIQEKHLTWSL